MRGIGVAVANEMEKVTALIGSLWGVVIIGGPILLALAAAYGVDVARGSRMRSRGVDVASPERRADRSGTRVAYMWGATVAAILFVVIIAWPFFSPGGLRDIGRHDVTSDVCSDKPTATIRNCSDEPKPENR